MGCVIEPSLTRSIAAARELAAGAGFSSQLPLLGGDLLMGLAYGMAGYLLFGWFELQARRRSTLERL